MHIFSLERGRWDPRFARAALFNNYVVVYMFKVTNQEFIWFHYSGHGTPEDDDNGDESDGKDECLVGVDDQLVRDDYLNAVLTKCL